MKDVRDHLDVAMDRYLQAHDAPSRGPGPKEIERVRQKATPSITAQEYYGPGGPTEQYFPGNPETIRGINQKRLDYYKSQGQNTHGPHFNDLVQSYKTYAGNKWSHKGDKSARANHERLKAAVPEQHHFEASMMGQNLAREGRLKTSKGLVNHHAENLRIGRVWGLPKMTAYHTQKLNDSGYNV